MGEQRPLIAGQEGNSPLSRGIIVIPAFEEAPRIGGVLRSIRASGQPEEILVIDDGSGDGTALVAGDAGARVISHPFNLGYGAALQTGYKYALRHGFEYVVQMDADGQHLAGEIPLLREPLLLGQADIVVGSRFIMVSGYEPGFARGLGRLLFHWLGRLAGIHITDPTSGFQALHRRAFELFCGDAFPVDFPDIDVLLLAHRRGLRLREVEVNMASSPRGSSLHSGIMPIYYVYKMMLSLWVSSIEERRAKDAGPDL